MRYAVANNARTRLTQTLLATDFIMHVESLELFPFDSDPYLLSVNDEIMTAFPFEDPNEGPIFEILQRGEEGTTPADHAIGDTVENRFTAGTYQALVDNIIDAARTALWSEITGKPSAFTPSAHTHTSAQITNFWNFWIGIPMPYPGSTPPTGFFECNGAAVSRTTYSKLFARIGTTFGAGNGSTTFNLPDLRGEFIRGYDNGRGVDIGRQFSSRQDDALQGHWHNIWSGRNDNTQYHAPGSQTGHLGNIFPANYDAGDNYVRNPVTDGINGTPRIASETRPRNVAFMYIIKY